MVPFLNRFVVEMIFLLYMTKLSDSSGAPPHTRLVGRFCERPGRTMCKREVYADYIAYCRANGHEPTNPSSFGKLVHSVRHLPFWPLLLLFTLFP